MPGDIEMNNISRSKRGFAKALVESAVFLFVLASLAGCSNFEGVELQGKVFDMLGVSGSGRRAAEPKLAPRNGLVVPPDNKALPAPGSGGTAVAAQANWPKDPEQVKVAAAARRQAIISKYCAEEDWWKRANPAKFDKMTQNGDLCQSGLSAQISKKVGG